MDFCGFSQAMPSEFACKLRSLVYLFFRLSLELRTDFCRKGGKDPHPQDFSLTKKTACFTKDQFRPY